MYVIPNSRREHVRELPGIDHVTLASSADGVKTLSVWQQSIAGGSATPPHRHDCAEVVIVTGGRGELHIEGEIHAFECDTTLIIPAHTDHQIINTGTNELKVIAVFSASPVETVFPNGELIPLPWST